jgi:hypothetical protein
MSALAQHSKPAARALTPEGVRAARRSGSDQCSRSAARSRRADAGTLTEMTRSLLRDARAAGAAEPTEPWRVTLDGAR